jgi:enoyl-CoA hydratase/carnithine racemase
VSVDFEAADGIATVTLNRPDKLNAMDWDTYAQITEAFRTIERDPGIRVGVVDGAG